ncbi:MAG: NAD(P)/FAD-dependent oxidoreductase [Anaerolineales bacterium]
MRILIIGNSATAVGAVESIRQHDEEAEIVVVSEESYSMIYSRPMLSHYLGGEIEKSRLAYRGEDFYRRYDVTPILGTRIVEIEPEEHRIRAASGETYDYDRLVISTGGTPIVPPIPGMDTGGVYTFTRLEDAEGIIQALEERAVERCIVVGGGMIGMKTIDALMKRGASVTILELAPHILGAALDETGSRMMTRLLESAGVNVLTENTVEEIQSSEGQIKSVRLRDGRLLDCDLLIFGIGVRPNAGLAEEAGIEVNRGIVVDQYMRTSALDIYAAGDVAEAYDLVVDMNRTVAIWPNAYRQGAVAGAHAVGVSRPDEGGVAMNTVEVCGVPAMSIGNGNASGEDCEVLMEHDAENHRYKRLVLQDDRLAGAILIGDVGRAGIYTGLIRSKVDVSDCRDGLLREHFGLLSLPDQYRKHIVTGLGIEV